jgi:F0F1-type ATP synthase epsilon subunit
MDYLTLTLRSPHELLFQGKALAVSSFNEKGLFDVLPFHSNFISVISKKIAVITENGEKKEFLLKENAVMNVEQNVVKIFTTPVGKNPSR